MADSVIAADVGRVIAKLRKIAEKAPIQLANEISDATYGLECLSVAFSTTTGSQWDRYNFTVNQRRILEILNSHFGKLVTRDALLGALYALRNDPPMPKIVDVWVCKIRKKFDAMGSEFAVQTAWGEGYKLVKREDYSPMGQGRPRLN